MDVERVFHMTGGDGETSYARNSSLQKKASDMVKHIIVDTIQGLYLKQTSKSLGIADLGCSSGPNTLSIIKLIVDSIDGTSRKMFHPTPEFRVYLNDLPTNDFNSIFMTLPDFYKELRQERDDDDHGPLSVFIAGVPGSFYGRLFPDNSLDFIHSSYSLHWLSRVPAALYDKKGKSINKRNIYISKTSPPMVCEAYLMQFQEDFSLFLRSRSEELVSGGKMVLILLGRKDRDHLDRGNAFFWELLSQSFAVLVSQGDVSEEKLDSYDSHFYAPSKDEIEDEVRKEGSFTIERLEMFEINEREEENDGEKSRGRRVAMTVRTIQESMISHHFGGGDIIDNLFEIYGRRIDEEIAKEMIRPISFVVVIRRN